MSTGCIVPTFCFTCHRLGSLRVSRVSATNSEQLQQGLADKEKRHILQKLTQIGGVQRYKDELRQALAASLMPWQPDFMRLTGAPWLRWSNI